MIDAGPSLQSAEGLSGTELLTYLLANGWTARPSRVDGISILSKDVPGADEPAEFILPVKPGFEDEHRRVADALRTVAAIESRSEASVAAGARRASAANETGQLLESARHVFQQTKDDRQRFTELMKLALLGDRRDVMDVKLFLKNRNDEESRDLLKALEHMGLD